MLNQTAIARPYAKALFMYANEMKAVSAWSCWLTAATDVVSSVEIQDLLSNPHVDVALQTEILNDIMQSCQGAQPGADHFVALLAKNHRIYALPGIAMEFERLRSVQEKTLKVIVKTVSLLTKDQEERLQKKLSHQLGQSICIQQEIDSSLIGGMIIYANHLVMDSSIKGQLKKLGAVLAA